ncbi:MAG: transposase [Gammaproteobacteria bacterium]
MNRKDKIAAARQLRKQGKTLGQIAESLEVSASTASLYCRGVLPRGTSPQDPRKTECVKLLRRFYTQGVPVSEIAKQAGVPASTLYDWRRESGIPKNPRSVYVSDELRERIRSNMTADPDGSLAKEAIRLYTAKELSTVDIAARFGVSSVTIGQWLKRSGVDRRQHPTRRTREKLRQANLGEKRYNWKGGITPSQIRLRNSLEMRLAREKCFERDNHTCQSCGKRGYRLNAHHIWPFHRFPHLKFDVNNLVTLCKKCHDDFHKKAGGHVKVAIGPFFHRIKEERALYALRGT